MHPGLAAGCKGCKISGFDAVHQRPTYTRPDLYRTIHPCRPGSVSRHVLTHSGGIACANAPMCATRLPSPAGTLVTPSVSACMRLPSSSCTIGSSQSP